MYAGQLYKEYYPRMFKAACRFCRNDQDIENAIHDVFVHFIGKFGQDIMANIENVGGFLATCVIRQVFKNKRQANHWHKINLVQVAPSYAEEKLDGIHPRERRWPYAERKNPISPPSNLSDRERRVFDLYVGSNGLLTLKEIALLLSLQHSHVITSATHMVKKIAG